MERLIAAILKLSRDGHRTFRAEPLDMAALVQALADAQRHQSDAVGAIVSIDGRLPDLVADRLATEQVFGNLLDNAVKYLDADRPGRVRVFADARDGNYVRFSIEDNGRGIAAKDQSRVFELFRRAGTQDRPGEGVGLAYVKSLVRAMGGTISLVSTPGKGTTFTVALPRKAREERATDDGLLSAAE